MKKLTDKAKKTLYKVISILTLILPMPIYLVVSASITSITPDYIVRQGDMSDFSLVQMEDYSLLTVDTTIVNSIQIEGNITITEGSITLPFDKDTVFQIEKGYYQIAINEDNTITWNNHTNNLFKKQLSYKVPIAVIFSILAIVIVILIIFKKMKLLNKHPRLGTFLTLGAVTVTFLILEMIINSMLGIFIVATATWGVYCLEYLIYNHKTIFKDKTKTDSDVLQSLHSMLEEYKR